MIATCSIGFAVTGSFCVDPAGRRGFQDPQAKKRAPPHPNRGANVRRTVQSSHKISTLSEKRPRNQPPQRTHSPSRRHPA